VSFFIVIGCNLKPPDLAPLAGVVEYDKAVSYLEFCRDAPIMLENLPIIPSSTSQNLYLLFFTISPIIPKLFCLIIQTNTANSYS